LPGTWCGIELDGEEGKGGNDGCVAGVRYFRCGANKGIFAPPSKLQHHDTLRASSEGWLQVPVGGKHSNSEVLQSIQLIDKTSTNNVFRPSPKKPKLIGVDFESETGSFIRFALR